MTGEAPGGPIAAQLYAELMRSTYGMVVTPHDTTRGDTSHPQNLLDYYELERRASLAAGRPFERLRWRAGLRWDASCGSAGCWRLTWIRDRGSAATVAHILSDAFEPVAVEVVPVADVDLRELPAHRAMQSNLVDAISSFVNRVIDATRTADIDDPRAREDALASLRADPILQKRATAIYDEYRKIRGMGKFEVVMPDKGRARALATDLSSWLPPSVRDAVGRGGLLE